MKSRIGVSIIALVLSVLLSTVRAVDAKLSKVDFNGGVYVVGLPEVHSLGGKVKLDLELISSAPLSSKVFMTVFRSRGVMPLPVVTLDGQPQAGRGNRYSVSFDLDLREEPGVSRYRLALWALDSGNSDEKIDLGEINLVVHPRDALEGLRVLAALRNFVVDSSSQDGVLGALRGCLDRYKINYTDLPTSSDLRLSSKSVLFTSRIDIPADGLGAVQLVFTDTVEFVSIERSGQSAKVLCPSRLFDGVDARVGQQMRLLTLLREALGE